MTSFCSWDAQHPKKEQNCYLGSCLTKIYCFSLKCFSSTTTIGSLYCHFQFYTHTTYNNRNFGMRAGGRIIIYSMYHLKWQLVTFFGRGGMKVFTSHKYLGIAINVKLIRWIERKMDEYSMEIMRINWGMKRFIWL